MEKRGILALHKIDGDTIDDIRYSIENSFGIQFQDEGLCHVETFGEFCDIVADKISPTNTDDCTTQRAFYTLRAELASILQIDKQHISPATTLACLTQHVNFEGVANEIEKRIHFDIRGTLEGCGAVFRWGVFIAFAALLFDWKISVLAFFLGVLIDVIVTNLAQKTKYASTPLGEIARRFAREHYTSLRRNPNACNRKEVERMIAEWFVEWTDVDRRVFTREARF